MNAFAQLTKPIDLLAICQDKPIEDALIIIDAGFCALYLERENQCLEQTLTQFVEMTKNSKECVDEKRDGKTIGIPELKPADKLKVRFYASHSFTTYFNSDITFKSSRYSVTIQDYEWAERGSREFFKRETWKEDGNNPAQMIDEPANTFTVSIEKNGVEYFLSAFHPKWTTAPNQCKYMVGTIDGVPVDQTQMVNNPFHGYEHTPGESKLVGNSNTHKQMAFTVGVAKRIKLLDSKKWGSIVWVPGVEVGVMVGQNKSVMVKKGEWWEFDTASDPYKIQGVGGGIINRIEINSPKERFGLFYENKLAWYHQHHGFLDGTQTYNLCFMGNSIGMKYMLYNPNNHKKK